jgi:hypothetical protein
MLPGSKTVPNARFRDLSEQKIIFGPILPDGVQPMMLIKMHHVEQELSDIQLTIRGCWQYQMALW